MAAAFVQKNDQFFNNGTPAASESLAFGSNNTAGNLLFVSVCNFSTTVVSVNDSQGNTYIPLPPGVARGGQAFPNLNAFYAPNCKAGPNTVTVAFGESGGDFVSIAIAEYSGVDSADSGIPTYATGDSTSLNSGAMQTQAPSIVVAFGGSSAAETYSAGGGFTLRSTPSGMAAGFADQINVAAGSYSGTLTLDGTAWWAAGVVSFYKTPSYYFVQEANHNDGVVTPSTTDVFSFVNPVTAGDLLFGNYVWLSDADPVGIQITSVTDNKGNTYTLLPRITIDSSNANVAQGPVFGQGFYCLNCKGGPVIITVHFDRGGADFIGASLSEWGGVDTLNGYAQHAVSGSEADSPALTTTHTCLLIGYATTESGFVTFIPGSGWIARTQNGHSVWLQQQLLPQPPGSYTSTVTGSAGAGELWASGIAAFYKAPPSSGRSVVCVMQ